MTQRFLAASAAVCVMAASMLLSQNRGALKTQIPFEFTFGNSRMPAGEYGIERGVAGGVLLVSKDGKVRKLVMGIHMEYPINKLDTRLVFRRHGDEYFLAQVWTRAQQWACEIPVSKVEREVMARNGQSREAEQVAVSAQ